MIGMNTWIKYLKRATLVYLALGVIVAFIFLAAADFDIDWTWDSLKMFLLIVLLWPAWAWFIVVMWLTYRQRR